MYSSYTLKYGLGLVIAIIMAAYPLCAQEVQMSSQRELIVVAAPQSDDPYYADVRDAIFDFHIAYAKAVLAHDDFLVLTDTDMYDRYANALGADYVLALPQADIWMRDFGLSNTADPVAFRYSAAGQGGGRNGQAEADYVQSRLIPFLQRNGLRFHRSPWINDGGNWVDDFTGRVVISRKFLRDNNSSEAHARRHLQEVYDLSHIAFIESDEQGGLEHADGVVAFIEPNTLVINAYPEDPDYAAELSQALRDGLPGVTLHEIVTPYNGDTIYDEKFGSACGLYTNMLVTPQRIYFPQFGIPEDAQALASVRSWTTKQVIPVRSEMICAMGGGVRCMSWQVRGENRTKLNALRKEGQKKN